MGFKMKSAMKKSKKAIIVSVILWLILTIVLIMPLAFSIFAATQKGAFNISKFSEAFSASITQPFDAFGILVKKNSVDTFFSTEFGFTIIFAIITFIGIVKSAPKHEYSNIEHGSSDWSRNGEQYKILNKNKGIILAENNYLPVNKQGNVNVLVVGRIRCW